MPLEFQLTFSVGKAESAAEIHLGIRNLGAKPATIQIDFPRIEHYAVPGRPASLLGCVPIELGAVGPLNRLPTLENRLVDPLFGYAHARDTLELATAYDGDGGGGFFMAAIDSDVGPITFSLSNTVMAGGWTTELAPGAEVDAPSVALGVHEADWRAAVDYYVAHRRGTWRFPEIPSWLRDAGAIYSFGGEGGGGIYQTQPTISLRDRISSFLELPRLLDEARQLGTDVIYLFDYWDGADQGSRPPYWNKGDYIPRSDLGGSHALKVGIDSVHEAGGRVLMYLEPFIVFHYSHLGKEKGAGWGARGVDGAPFDHQFVGNYTMPSWLEPWQNEIADLAVELVTDYGADGVFLDSYGWQWNWPSKSLVDGRLRSASEWNQGVIDLLDGVRAAIRRVKPEAVVLTESFDIHLAQHEDGALDASFAWNSGLNGGRLLASPVRYAAPELNVYSAGRDLNQLNQIFAAGSSLALGPQWLSDAAYVKRLVEIRREYKDALIHGRQVYQPETGQDGVAAYVYAGKSKRVLTVVNTNSSDYKGNLGLTDEDAVTSWLDALSGSPYTSAHDDGGHQLSVRVAAEGLVVLVRQP